MNLTVSEQNFFHKLQSNLLHVLMYEDASLQKRARDLIPLDQFMATSRQKSREAETSRQNGEKPLDIRDFLLLELLNWFKQSFFSWVDCPECQFCRQATVRRGMLEPNDEEKRFGANRVEGFQCQKCGKEERFPRYNHPGRLLETRRGRCGEWANCFTLCCRAVGFEARYVLDWTDHVWTEVYSRSQERWLHCDSCENACDKPLMYEVGWGKNLSYVIAFSKDDIKDVTWRYTRKYDEVLKRRNECREDWLVKTVLKMRDRKRNHLDEIRRTELLNRTLREFVELLVPKDVKEGEEQGRISGSLAWRLARGEAGNKPQKDPYIIKPSQSDIANKMLKITYNSAEDVYRFSNGQIIKGWDSAVESFENVFRKEEHDWKIVYLAIAEGRESGSVSWKFDVSGCPLSIDKVSVQCESTTFQKGGVQWRLCGKNSCLPLFAGKRLETEDFSGEKELTLKAILNAGQGMSGWQHAQLFRLSSDDKSHTPFEITVTFK